MTRDNWRPFAGGNSIGTTGTESGLIVNDDEHLVGARITLEEGTTAAPFSITCGIYGWMVHTRFFETAEDASVEFEAMKKALGEILTQWQAEGDNPNRLSEDILRFVSRYP